MDLMKTVTETSQNTPDAKEQLHRLNEQKKLDLENSLLKEALTESAGRFEKSLAESKQLQEKSEISRKKDWDQIQEKIKQLTESVKDVHSSSQQLENAFKETLKCLSDDLEGHIVAETKKALSEQMELFNCRIINMDRQLEKLTNNLNLAANNVKQAEEKLFRFDRGRSILFWVGQVLNILAFLGVIYLILNR